MRRSVDTGLKCIAATAAEGIRQAPRSAATREREANHRVGRDPIVDAGGETASMAADIVASGSGRITARVIGAAEGCAPNIVFWRIGRL